MPLIAGRSFPQISFRACPANSEKINLAAIILSYSSARYAWSSLEMIGPSDCIPELYIARTRFSLGNSTNMDRLALLTYVRVTAECDIDSSGVGASRQQRCCC